VLKKLFCHHSKTNIYLTSLHLYKQLTVSEMTTILLSTKHEPSLSWNKEI